MVLGGFDWFHVLVTTRICIWTSLFSFRSSLSKHKLLVMSYSNNRLNQ